MWHPREFDKQDWKMVWSIIQCIILTYIYITYVEG